MKKHYLELSHKDIEKFKVLYKKYYGVSLNDEQANIAARQLITFMTFILYDQ